MKKNRSGDGASWTWRRAWFGAACRDGGRALGALVYWNLRKTIYGLKGRRGTPPCQHAHDVADRLPPQCEAVWDWAAPGRFRRVCPALARTANGWRCSATSAQVRPYWGRAAVVYATLAAALYMGGTGALWWMWQRVGYDRIAYPDVAWPGRWPKVKEAQADHFRRQAREALIMGDVSKALLSLTTAEGFAKGGFGERMMLARLWAQAGNAGYASQLFHVVQADYPARAEESRAMWHDQLLANGQLGLLADLCLQRIVVSGDKAPESLWEYSLVFALDHGRMAGQIRKTRGEDLQRLPDRLRAFIEVLAQWQDGRTAEAARDLAAMRFTEGERMAMRRQIEWLARMGRADEAGVELIRNAGRLGGFEVAALRYSVDTISGRADEARADFIGMLRAPLSPAEADRLCGLVIFARDGASLRRAPGVFALEPLNTDAPAQAAFWVAALAGGSPELARGARMRFATAAGGGELPPVETLDFRRQKTDDPHSPFFIASYVALPRETIYAMIGAMADDRRD
jgi:hypothetical protein